MTEEFSFEVLLFFKKAEGIYCKTPSAFLKMYWLKLLDT
jgi:hypothetical protein